MDERHDPELEEQNRRQALADLKILDTPVEERFDRMTRDLATELDTPIAYVALLDGERQWLKSEVGGMQGEMPQELSYCNHTIRQDQPLVVADASQDERFRDLPLTQDGHMRFYAGVPISDSQGQTIGTVCVADREVRELEPDKLAVLEQYAQRVEAELNAPPTVFVSYAHEDEVWKDRLVKHCEVLRRQGLIDIWVDRKMASGQAWREEIRNAIERAKVAVLLVSAEFLTSDFILGEEVPRLLERRDREGLQIVPVLVKSCCWENVDWLASMNLWPQDARPLAKGKDTQIDEDLTDLAGTLATTLARLGRILEMPATESPDLAARQPDEPAALALRPPVAPTRPAAASLHPPTEPQHPVAAHPAPAAAPQPPAPSPQPAAEAPTAPCPEPPAETEPGPSRVLLGKYELLAPLGKLGSTQLFAAQDTRLGRRVTLRLLPGESLQDPEVRARFERQARILASLEHPSIATLFDLDEEQGMLLLVLQELDGQTLEEQLKQGAFEIEESLRIAAKIADALGAAHRQGIVHRGLDPSSLMISPEGRVWIVDFGLAKVIESDRPAPAVTEGLRLSTMMQGSSPYASPERLRNQGVDTRTDVWGFGSVLWTLLAGVAPFRGPTPIDTVAKILEHEPSWEVLPAVLPDGVRDLLGRCLDKDPARRFADMTEVAALLRQLGY